MALSLFVLGEALMDCITQSDGTLLPLMGGSPYNLARAAALQGADVGYLPPFSSDAFGQQLKAQGQADGIRPLSPDSPCPTSLAVVTVRHGQPSYGFYREGIADRDYQPETLLQRLAGMAPGVLHTGSLMLVPPEDGKILRVLEGAKALGWTISVDVNLRPRMARRLDDYRTAVLRAAAWADWLKASDEDLHALGFGATRLASASAVRERFAQAANQRIAFTFGADGAYLWAGGREAWARAPQVEVVDTVGAGDTFWGTCLAEWCASGASGAPDLEVTLRRAMLAAAINCSRKGCQPPSREEMAAAADHAKT